MYFSIKLVMMNLILVLMECKSNIIIILFYYKVFKTFKICVKVTQLLTRNHITRNFFNTPPFYSFFANNNATIKMWPQTYADAIFVCKIPWLAFRVCLVILL